VINGIAPKPSDPAQLHGCPAGHGNTNRPRGKRSARNRHFNSIVESNAISADWLGGPRRIQGVLGVWVRLKIVFCQLAVDGSVGNTTDRYSFTAAAPGWMQAAGALARRRWAKHHRMVHASRWPPWMMLANHGMGAAPEESGNRGPTRPVQHFRRTGVLQHGTTKTVIGAMIRWAYLHTATARTARASIAGPCRLASDSWRTGVVALTESL